MGVNLNIPLPDCKTVKTIVGVQLGLVGAYYLAGACKNYQERRHLTALRLKRQAERKEQCRSLEQRFPLTPERAAIANLPFDELVEKLQSRDLKVRQVLEAFIAKALVVHNETNCITEFIPQMFEWAEELDALPTVKGPLHGVPIGVKDDHHMVGLDSTIGYSRNLYKPMQDTAVVVQTLVEAGALPFCRTSLAQTVFTISCDNPIFGTTLNPLNKGLSPGGSSCGSGALVGGGGAPFATGSDIAGSLRIPAHFCGISTLRPTIGRFSGRGVSQCLENSAGYVGVSGIMADKAKTLATVQKIMLLDGLQNKKDPLAVPIPWNNGLYESREHLRIGYFLSLPFFPTIGDTPDTVLKAKQALEALGHTLVPFELGDSFELMDLYTGLADADGGDQNYKKLKNDAVSFVAVKYFENRSILQKLATVVKNLIWKRSVRDFHGNPATKKSEVVWDYLFRQAQVKHEVLDRMKRLNLDLILCPAFPYPASTIEDTETLIGGCVYTATWNLLDFPAGNTPFGVESCTKIDEYDDQGDFFLKLAKKGIRLANGMPIGVQIVGKPFREEQVLRILVELEEYKANIPNGM